MTRADQWPELPYDEWAETCTTLHLWAQILGKVRLAACPWLNHSWQATLYPTARGLTTWSLAARGRVFQVDLDLLDHCLRVSTADGDRWKLPLEGQTVSSFHRELLAALKRLGVGLRIHGAPNELPEATPFAEDERGVYDPEATGRFHRAVLQSERVMRRFRSRFLGKSSPVHLFWGSFDLAVTRFSGRPAPPHPGGIPHLPDEVTREAYSHEVSSAGWWPGHGGLGYPAYYSYAYPAPEVFGESPVAPADAFYDEGLGEFLLPYDAVRTAADPDAALLAFLQSTYEAAAERAGWDREALEREEGPPPGLRSPASSQE
jgi:hypothetical protein